MEKIEREEAKKIVRQFQLLGIAVLVVLASGTTVFHFVEDWRWLDAFYFSVVSLTTVGYGDFTPKTDAGKLITVLFLIIGIGLMAGLINNLVRSRIAKQSLKR
jgi:predicted membrane channel-forming protein YqfA (hemolysin III family)